jgi:hypothetical protein
MNIMTTKLQSINDLKVGDILYYALSSTYSNKVFIRKHRIISFEENNFVKLYDITHDIEQIYNRCFIYDCFDIDEVKALNKMINFTRRAIEEYAMQIKLFEEALSNF